MAKTQLSGDSHRIIIKILRFLSLLSLLTFFFMIGQGHAQGQAISLELKGAVGPATVEYLLDEFEEATLTNEKFIILLMDTPGGLDSSMRDIIKAILSSPIPVITYVYPDGSRAASAGTYILYASHVAAMAPATNLGAATPIQIGGDNSGPPMSEEQKEKDDQKGAPPKDALKEKIINDSSAYIRSLAERHGRNVTWAEQAVREAVSLTAQEALKENVIDVVALNIEDLLAQVHGMEVAMEAKQQIVKTKDVTIRHIAPSWRTAILQTISDPNIAYILLLLGIYGLIYELAHPGFLLPGVAGGISLLLAFYALQVLPVNYSGLALLLLGIAFLAGEFFMPSFGALGIGGIISFIMGSLILFKDEGISVSPFLILSLTFVSATLLFWLLQRLRNIRKLPMRTGAESLIGMTGTAAADFQHNGRIWIRGESWQVESRDEIHVNDTVEVTEQRGLKLYVKKVEETK